MALESSFKPRTGRSAWFRGAGPGSWLLAILLALLAIRTAALDRVDWPGFVGDEATYLMAAESLAWDGDFVYDRGDYDRFQRHWSDRPEMLLVLQSPDRGQTLVFGKPFFYPLAVAPFARLWPARGVLVMNVLFMALAAALASRALTRHLGGEAPLWVASFLFGSVAFAYTGWAHSDSFLMSLVAIILSLAFLDADRREAATAEAPDGPYASSKYRLDGQIVRWLIIGALTAVVIFSRPFYAPLVLPLAWLLPRSKSRKAAISFGLALLVVAGGAAAGRWALAGSATSYTGDRAGVDARVALPMEDFPRESWEEARSRSSASWHEALRPFEQETEAGLWIWNPVYFAVGEHVGLLPYFLPLLLVLFACRLDRVRWILLAAVVASVAAFFLFRPFNFFGGGAAIGNRYFVPLYPALWFLVARRPSPRVRRMAPFGVLLVAGLFMWPLWLEQGAYPLTSDLTYRFVSPMARKLLPYETTQSHLKPGGQEDVIHHGIWVKALGPQVRIDEKRIWVRREEWAELLIASPAVLRELEVVAPAGPESRLEVSTGEIVDRTRGSGVATYRLSMPRTRARHSMWWTWEPLNLYRLRLRFRGEADETIVGFYLKAAQAGSGQPGPADSGQPAEG